MKKLLAEFLGTFLLVFCCCGGAYFAAEIPKIKISGDFWLLYSGYNNIFFTTKIHNPEFLRTHWLAFDNSNALLFAIGIPDVDPTIIWVITGLLFSVLSTIYALSDISGGHFNPAISFGLWASNKFPTKNLLLYILAQFLGTYIAAETIYSIAYDKTKNFAFNGFGIFIPPQGYSTKDIFIAVFLLTVFF
nr:aquaporin [Flavobacterium sp. 9]